MSEIRKTNLRGPSNPLRMNGTGKWDYLIIAAVRITLRYESCVWCRTIRNRIAALSGEILLVCL